VEINYDWADIPVGTPMSFGGILVLNGKTMEVSEEDQATFKKTTGMTLVQAARSTANLSIPRKKVNS
jgi:hypothetical protein